MTTASYISLENTFSGLYAPGPGISSWFSIWCFPPKEYDGAGICGSWQHKNTTSTLFLQEYTLLLIFSTITTKTGCKENQNWNLRNSLSPVTGHNIWWLWVSGTLPGILEFHSAILISRFCMMPSANIRETNVLELFEGVLVVLELLHTSQTRTQH